MACVVVVGAFGGGGFGMVFECWEEPRCAALAVVAHVRGSCGESRAIHSCDDTSTSDRGAVFGYAALFVEFGGLGFVEDDIGRPPTSGVGRCDVRVDAATMATIHCYAAIARSRTTGCFGRFIVRYPASVDVQ